MQNIKLIPVLTSLEWVAAMSIKSTKLKNYFFVNVQSIDPTCNGTTVSTVWRSVFTTKKRGIF
jgi:hypothetical protein